MPRIFDNLSLETQLLGGLRESLHGATSADFCVGYFNFVAQLCTAVLAMHAAPGSRTEQWCRDVLALGKPLWTLDAPANARLIALGARPVQADSLPPFFDKPLKSPGVIHATSREECRHPSLA